MAKALQLRARTHVRILSIVLVTLFVAWLAGLLPTARPNGRKWEFMRTMRTKQRFATDTKGFYDPAWLPEGRIHIAGDKHLRPSQRRIREVDEIKEQAKVKIVVPSGYGVPPGEYEGKPGEAPEAILARVLRDNNIAYAA